MATKSMLSPKLSLDIAQKEYFRKCFETFEILHEKEYFLGKHLQEKMCKHFDK